jgi:hypothetical protein
MQELSLTPIGEPPTRGARWCPNCRAWIEAAVMRGRRRCFCGAAVVRQTRIPKSLPNELWPGIDAEFDDPRDR